MNKLCQLLNLENEDVLFAKITNSFKEKITQWNYFVNWNKVFANISPIEKELNLLNYLVGKENIEEETFNLIKQYPQVIRAFPILIAIRDKSIDILIETKDFIYKKFSFTSKNISDKECRELTEFIIKSGLGEILRDKKIKNLVDYAIGVEVGLDSNGRKNRGGTLMETMVEEFVADACNELDLAYMAQATAKKIKEHWNIDVAVDKSSRIIDFAINKNGKLFFIETNFYGGGGSKLKSTATEYIEMNRYWNNQGIEFIWVTDGAGWKSTLKPLREYFDKANYLLNLEMLKDEILKKIVG
ncbi:MAG TPA: type II restriction endonuclease [Pyrinomonadaceae bacterium]|nr:type II restriction endonuclease [Pyrinomonadaceae bacterium]